MQVFYQERLVDVWRELIKKKSLIFFMKEMEMKKVFASLAVLALASSAFASVTLEFTGTDLGGGLTAWDFYMHDSSAYEGSWSTYNLVFTGHEGSVICQNKAFGAVDINTESSADTYEGISGSGYVKATDTWYYDVTVQWGVTAPNNVDVSGTSQLTLNNLGTAAGVPYGDALLIHIVSDGNIAWNGAISRQGANYDTNGVTPEPMTMSLLGVGALALIRRRK